MNIFIRPSATTSMCRTVADGDVMITAGEFEHPGSMPDELADVTPAQWAAMLADSSVLWSRRRELSRESLSAREALLLEIVSGQSGGLFQGIALALHVGHDGIRTQYSRRIIPFVEFRTLFAAA